MKSTLKNKKLLILGANIETIPLIQTAKEMGVITLVTDHKPEAPAKKHADKPFNVNGLDLDALEKLAKNEKIDGVIVGVADRLVSTYQQLCERLDLPCYATKEQCDVFTDKRTFNDLCNKFEIPIIPEYKISKNPTTSELNSINYPVFVKPVDSNSGKGMSICYKPDEIKPAINYALSFSNSKKFIIDELMNCDNIFLYYTFKNGEVYLSAIADRYTSEEQGKLSKVCLGGTYPSSYIDLYFEKLHFKIVKMFNSQNLQNGVLMISAFIKNNIFHLYDPGFRLQGEAPNLLIEAVNGFDQKKMLVNFALTGCMGVDNLKELNKPEFNGKFAATIWLLLKEGSISKIKGIDNFKEDSSVVHIQQRFNSGDKITKEDIGTEAQVFARVYVVCHSEQKLSKKITEIQNTIEVLDTNGAPMLLKGFNYTAPKKYNQNA